MPLRCILKHHSAFFLVVELAIKVTERFSEVMNKVSIYGLAIKKFYFKS